MGISQGSTFGVFFTSFSILSIGLLILLFVSFFEYGFVSLLLSKIDNKYD